MEGALKNVVTNWMTNIPTPSQQPIVPQPLPVEEDAKFTSEELKRFKSEVALREKYLRQIKADQKRSKNVDPNTMNERMERLQDLESTLERRQNFLQAQFLNGTLPELAFRRQIQPDREFMSRGYKYGQ